MTHESTTKQRARQTRRFEIIKTLFAAYYGPKWDPNRLFGRREPWVTIRQAAMLLSRELVPASYPDVAVFFGMKDHNTVICACQAVPAKSKRLPWLAKDVYVLRRTLDVKLKEEAA